MAVTPGARIGQYEVISKLGEGGMGEVYRARDLKLNRDVALKILPALFAQDPDRLARFEREAQTLAALNHPNIAHVYDAHAGSRFPGEAENATSGPAFLAMELVEGEDLSVRIARGALPLPEALPIARQIADALETAHEQGIVHRDLKPANIKVRDDGTVKVLDFGLAKAMGGPDATASADAMNSPTLTARATQMGMIIGTAAYMAPEQAKGRPVDKRADVWAFGAVLYEMLTGRRAFEGEDVSTTLAAVLMRDPEWTALPAEMPPALRTLVRRCLERDPRARLRDIGEARLLLADPQAMSGREPAAPPAPSSAPVASRAPWFIAVAAAMAAVAFAALWWRGASPAPASRIHASIAPPAGHGIGVSVALSPDGRWLVFDAWSEETGASALWVRDLRDGESRKLPGTDGATQPFWAPSGTEIAFFAEGKLKKTDLQGSPPQVICEAPSPRGGAWGPDGTIVFTSSFRTGLEKVSASGGTPTPITTLDAARGEKSHRWPVFLPDGKHVLFVAQTGEATSKDDASTIEALMLADGARTRLLTANSSPLYSADGYLLFWREGALRAQPFDANRLALSGTVFAVAPGVAFDSNEYATASVSANGMLVYSTANGTNRTKLLQVDRTGRVIRTIAESVLVEGGLSLSHDGTRLAVALTADGARDTDIWIYDLQRGSSGPLTFEEGGDRYPVWSADDAAVLYSNDRKNDGVLFKRFTDGRGQAELVAENTTGMWPFAWSRDGGTIIVGVVTSATSFDLLRMDTASKQLTPLVNTPFNDQTGALSPDGRWLAYQTDETGRYEIYVRSLADEAGRWRISTQGGFAPLWRMDGRELYFATPLGQLMAVSIEPGTTFRAAPPQELLRSDFRLTQLPFREFAPMPDGQSFVVDVLLERGASLLTVVTNWAAGTK